MKYTREKIIINGKVVKDETKKENIGCFTSLLVLLLVGGIFLFIGALLLAPFALPILVGILIGKAL